MDMVVTIQLPGHMQEESSMKLPADMKDDTLAYTGLKKIAKLFAIEKEIDTFLKIKSKYARKSQNTLVDVVR